MRPPTDRQDFAWILALWAAAAIFFWPVLGGGQSFYFRDTIPTYYPQATIARNAMTAGELPLWDNRISLGYPFQADPHSMLFYPLALLLLLPMPRAYDLLVTVHVPLGGTFLYLLLRRWHVGAPAAAFAGAVWMFCGYTVSITSLTTILKGSTWAPAALFCFDGFLAHGSRRAILATAGVLAVQGSGTDPQYVLMTAGLLALARWLRPTPCPIPALRCLGAVALSGAVAFCLLAYQFAPLLRLVAESSRGRGTPAHVHEQFQIEPANLYNLIVPIPFPDIRHADHPASYRGKQLPLYGDLYWGFPCLALALASLGRWKGAGAGSRAGPPESPDAGRAAALGLGLFLAALALAMGTHTPLFGWMTTVCPPLGLFRYPGKYLLVAGFCLAAPIALGFEGVTKGLGGCRRVLLWVSGAGAAGLALAMGGLALDGNALAGAFLASANDGPGLDSVNARLAAGWMAQTSFTAAMAMALFAAIALVMREKIPSRSAAILIGAAALADLGATTWRGLPFAEDGLLSGPSAAVPRIVELSPSGIPPRIAVDPFKLTGPSAMQTVFATLLLQRELLCDIRGSPYGIANLAESMSIELESALQLYELMASADPATRDSLTRAAGARFRLEHRDWPQSAPETAILGQWGPAVLKDLGEPCPRVFVAGRSVGASREATGPHVATLTALPDLAVYYRAGLRADEYVRTAPLGRRDCRLARYAQRELDVEFQVDGDGLLVVLDAYYPGWRATVDGAPREIVKVAGLFRGVVVRKGERLLSMTYAAPEFWLGLIVSGVTLLLAALAAWRLRPGSAPALLTIDGAREGGAPRRQPEHRRS